MDKVDKAVGVALKLVAIVFMVVVADAVRGYYTPDKEELVSETRFDSGGPLTPKTWHDSGVR